MAPVPPFRPRARRVLDVWLALAAVFHVALIVAFAVTGHFTVSHYTYWNYAIVTLFLVLLFVALLVAGRGEDTGHAQHDDLAHESVLHARPRVRMLVAVTRYVFPVAVGSAFLVFALIIIIVDMNDEVFLGDTTERNGTVSVGRTHTFDALLHDEPLIVTLVTMFVGYWAVVRAVLRPTLWRIVYWYAAPLVPLVTYSLLFDPFTTYPTKIEPALGVAIALGLYVAWMTLVWVAARATPVLHAPLAHALAHHDDVARRAAAAPGGPRAPKAPQGPRPPWWEAHSIRLV